MLLELLETLAADGGKLVLIGSDFRQAFLKEGVVMKAIVYHRYDSPDVLKCEEIEKSTAGDNEVVVTVRSLLSIQLTRTSWRASLPSLADCSGSVCSNQRTPD